MWSRLAAFRRIICGIAWIIGTGQGIARAEDLAEVLCARGIQRYRDGDYEAAAQLLKRAVDQNAALVAAGHYLGRALIKQDKIAEGRRALAAAAKHAPDDPQLLTDLGLAYLAEGNAAWAVRYLRAARDLAPHNMRIRYHLAVAMMKLGEAAAAIPELEEVRLAPEEMPRETVILQLGLAHYMNKDWQESRRQLGSIIIGEKGSLARGLLRAAYEAQGIKASWVSTELTAGFAVDTNPLYEAKLQQGAEITAGAGPSIAGSLALRPWVDARNLVWGEVSASRVFYSPTSEEPADKDFTVEDASTSELRASAFYALRFPGEKASYQLSAGYDFGMTFMDGNQRLVSGEFLTDANHIFLEQHGGYLTLQRLCSEGSTVQLRYGLVREDFADLPRSNLGNELTLEYSGSVLSNQLMLLSYLAAKHEAAHSDDYDAFVSGFGLGLSYLAPWDLVLGLRLAYEQESYFNSAKGRWGKQRLDNELDATAEVGRALPWSLRLRAVYIYQRNFSTVQSFDYDRNLFTLNLSWSYQ